MPGKDNSVEPANLEGGDNADNQTVDVPRTIDPVDQQDVVVGGGADYAPPPPPPKNLDDEI